MNVIISQIIVALVIVSLFIVTFKFDKTKITIKEMTIITLLCVLTAILSKTLSIKFPPGQPIFIISFASAIAITIGLLFSPRLALIAGLIIDVIGILLAPASGDNSMPFLGFTLTAMLSCYIPAVLVKVTKKRSPKFMNSLVLLILVLSVIGASVYLFSVDSLSIDKNATDLTNPVRYALVGSFCVIAVAIYFINRFLITKISADNKIFLSTSHLTLIVLVEQIVCSIILTTLWINIMYGIPVIVASTSRIIKMLLQLPLNVTIIYLVLRYIPNSYKKNLYLNDSE